MSGDARSIEAMQSHCWISMTGQCVRYVEISIQVMTGHKCSKGDPKGHKVYFWIMTGN